MVSRSIVGRFLILAVLLVSLGVIAQAALIISKDGGKKVASKTTGASAGSSLSDLAPLGAAMAAAAPIPPVAPAPGAAPSAVAASLDAETTASTEAAAVRVVYPGPLGDAPIQPQKFSDPAPASPLSAPALPAATPPAALQPPASLPREAAAVPATVTPAAKPVSSPDAEIASVDPAAVADPAPATPAAGKGVNLNRASVEALNHIGAGRIGQTIVQHRPYRSVEDLVTKRVLRRSVYDQIKNQVAAQ